MSYQQNLRRWLASNVAGSTLVTVVEIDHSSFTRRFINDYGSDISVTLEAQAGGQQVATEFVAFTFKLPSVKNTTKQELDITMDNTSGIPYSILNSIPADDRLNNPVIVNLRFYLDDDLGNPQLVPPIRLEVITATAEGSAVNLRCVSPFMRRDFTGMLYKGNLFPSLYSFWT